jgi:hypothetical protein
MQAPPNPGPWLVTAGYDLAIAFSPIFKDQPSTGKPNKTTYPNSQINRLVVSPENRIACAVHSIPAIKRM